METLISALIAFLRAAFLTRTSLALENAALRQQLTIYQRVQKRVRLRDQDRLFWVLLRRIWSGRGRPLIIDDRVDADQAREGPGIHARENLVPEPPRSGAFCRLHAGNHVGVEAGTNVGLDRFVDRPGLFTVCVGVRITQLVRSEDARERRAAVQIGALDLPQNPWNGRDRRTPGQRRGRPVGHDEWHQDGRGGQACHPPPIPPEATGGERRDERQTP